MAKQKQTRQTSRRLRAAGDREKPRATGASPSRIDVDRGLARGLIGLGITAAAFLAINFDALGTRPGRLLLDRWPLGTAVLILGAGALMGVYLYKHCPRLVTSKSQLLVFGVLCVAPLMAARATALNGLTPHLVPLGAVVFVIALCHGTQVAVTTSFLLAVFVAVALRDPGFPAVHPARG